MGSTRILTRANSATLFGVRSRNKKATVTGGGRHGGVGDAGGDPERGDEVTALCLARRGTCLVPDIGIINCRFLLFVEMNVAIQGHKQTDWEK